MARKKNGVTPTNKTQPAPAVAGAVKKEPQEGIPVAKIPAKKPRSATAPKVEVGPITIGTGRPSKVNAAMQRFASYTGGGGANADVMQSYGGNYYSPELSTDFLQLPQSMYERWAMYRFFYYSNPFIGRAIDLHTTLPLSRVRINKPRAKDQAMADAATKFCERWASEVELTRKLYGIMRDYHLIGVVNIFAEDSNPDIPEELMYDLQEVVTDEGDIIIHKVEKDDRTEAFKWMKKNYRGWTDLRVLPPEQVKSQTFNFTSKRMVQMVSSARDRQLVEQAENGDRQAMEIVKSMSPEVVEAIRSGQPIPLGTDPDAGSFCYIMERDRVDYETSGHSILERCMRTLIQHDKVRQANAQISSRHMTPIRLIWAENMNEGQLDELRAQVDLALADPDYSIITNYQVNWEEMGSDQRLLDVTSELDVTLRELYAGLGVTEGLMTGESTYSGDRISLDVINTQYMGLREQVQDFVEKYLFKPMCRRMGFIERDEDDNEVVIYPKMSFTRLALRDNADTFDALYNLYTKGSLPISVIYDLFNIDPISAKQELLNDMFTVNDANFNELSRNVLSTAGNTLAEGTDVSDKLARYLGLKPKEKPADDRFG